MYSKERNLFAFNNLNFFHGSDYNKDHYKILMKTFGRVKYPGVLKKQVIDTKEKNLPIWEVNE